MKHENTSTTSDIDNTKIGFETKIDGKNTNNGK